MLIVLVVDDAHPSHVVPFVHTSNGLGFGAYF
jgi:hypothetical protein